MSGTFLSEFLWEKSSGSKIRTWVSGNLSQIASLTIFLPPLALPPGWGKASRVQMKGERGSSKGHQGGLREGSGL